VVPHLTHGGGSGGWNSNGMRNGSRLTGGSTTGLSATDAWLRAAAGDEMRLSFVVGGVVSFARVRRLWRLSRPSIVTSIGARTRFQSSVRADAWMLTLSGFHLKSG
jgi:hypothetical protein